MLPFEISDFELTLAKYKRYYDNKKGDNSYDKIFNKIQQSNGFAKLCGLSISQHRTPTPFDFRVITSNMYLFGSMEKITLAALIALKIWKEQVNRKYNFVSNATIEMLFQQIIMESKIMHL